uniref:28 kDa salivary protein SP05 n=1 Tax=Phlebotomus perniciosus TaxID=13204 RepID=Q0ZS58_PHLPE|nr:28 kDa salivary protein SP05 [Phlebotomus perniciosus]
MFKKFILVALVVVVAQCALPAIPIARQGKDFPVPFVSEDNNPDDYFDDQYYPDINDAGVGSKAPQGSRKPPNRGTIPPPRGDQVSSGGRTPPGRVGQGTSPTKDKRARPQINRNPTGTVGQGGSPGTKDKRARPQINRNPTGSGTKPRDRELVIRDKPPSGSQGGKPGRQVRGPKEDLSRYQNAPAKLIFKSSNINTAGKTPSAVKLFKTKKDKTVVAKGGPNDVYEVELLDENFNNMSLRIQIMDRKSSTAILSNPDRNLIVGRVKTYRGLR